MRAIEAHQIPFDYSDWYKYQMVTDADFIEWVESIEDGFDQDFIFVDGEYAYFRERNHS